MLDDEKADFTFGFSTETVRKTRLALRKAGFIDWRVRKLPGVIIHTYYIGEDKIAEHSLGKI